MRKILQKWLCLYVLCRNSEAHIVLKRTNLWIQEIKLIKFNVGQIIQAKLWNMVYCLECYVSIGMAIFVKWKFILLKGKAEDVILYQWKSETEALSVAEQLLLHCKDRDWRDPLQQENYNLWCNKSHQRPSAWFTWSLNLMKKGKSH